MSRIEDLIAKYCPTGVEYKTLGDLGTFMRGGGPQKKHLLSSGKPCIHYGQIYTRYSLYTGETLSFVSPEVFDSSRIASPGDVIIADTSENDEDLAKSVAWIGNEKVAVSNHTLIYSSALNPKYVSYFLSSHSFQKQKRRHITGVKVRSISETGMSKIKIPVPPLEVQDEIVRILDSFTKLEAELETELEARRKQYEYYRDSLLSFENLNNRVGGIVRLISLRDVSSYSVEKISACLTDNNSYVGVDNLIANKRGKKPSDYAPNTSKLSKFYPGDILIGNIRPYLRKIWQSNLAGGASGDVLVISINDEKQKEITSRFLYHVLASEDFFEYNNRFAKGAKMPRGDKKAIMDYKFSLPRLSEQERIVAILDKFDALVNDLSSGLPAEIAARRKQYEYYHDRLLTFTPAK